jgi:hypothetical protein
MKKLLLVSICVTLGGCQAIGNFADDVGSYMPVLSDERCEHWQCFTDEGKAQSDYNKMMMQKRSEQEKLEEEMEEKGIQPPQQPVVQQPQPSYSNPELDPWNNYKP